MSFMKSFINTFVLATAALLVASCVPKATEKKAICGANQAFDTVSRSCYSISEVRVKPKPTKSSATVLEEQPQTIALTYTDGNNDKAISCKVSSISSNIEMISPLITNGGIFTKGSEVSLAIQSVAGAMPAPDTAAALAASTAMQTALANAQKSLYYPTVISQMGVFKTQITIVLGLATSHPSDAVLQSYVTSAQARMDEFTPLFTQTTNRCECSAGVCSTVIVPKINKSGASGFSYSITDVDGESATKAVAVTITPMSRASSHLLPVAESSYFAFNESNTSTPLVYPMFISSAIDALGTPATSLQYTLVSAPLKGVLSGCMNLANTLGPSDSDCLYTPTSGDTYDTAFLTKASVAIVPITFYAKNYGAFGNNYSVQILDLHADNSAVDGYVNSTEAFGMVSSSYGESFIRISNNTVKIFINPGVTTTDDIANLINAHPQASLIMTATSAMTSYAAVAPLSTLSGGNDAFDTFTYRVSNGMGVSKNATVMIQINPVNDAPIVPKTLSSVYLHTETLLEEEVGHVISMAFRDVDSAATNFTVDVKVDTSGLACSNIMDSATFNSMITSTFFTVPATTTALATSCLANGDCTKDIALTANLNFSGTACLYYRVTDIASAVSEIQPVKIIVTPVNDAPLLSSVAMPSNTPLVDTTTKEDLDPVSTSYSDIYAGPGGGVFEAAQELTVTATSLNTALIPNTVCQNYTPVAGNPVGSIVPTAAGLVYFDTVNYRCYVSTGLALATDWKLLPSLTVYPNCAYDYFGQGSPIGSVAATISGKHYLDTTNNRCYISDLTLTDGWKQDVAISNYKVSYVPMEEQSGYVDIKVTVKDNGGVLNSGVDTTEDTFQLQVLFVNDPPFFDSTTPIAIHTNEGGAVQSDAFYVDEDRGRTADENTQNVRITSIVSDNTSVLPPSAISIFYDLNNNGVQDANESRAIGVNLEDPTDALDPTKNDVHLHPFYLKLDPVDGVSGNANVTITVSDDDATNPKTTSLQFSFIVHPVAALHGGWDNISSVGIKTDKLGVPVADSEIKCNYNKSTDAKKCSSQDCTGIASPHSVIVPDAANVLYWDSSSKRCYRSTGTSQYSWVEHMSTCPITREPVTCGGDNCMTNAAAPSPLNAIISTRVGIYYYNTNSNTCYVSTAKGTNTNWQVYVPSKVTLAWKPFTLSGSGASIGAQVAGWNVYRREATTDYNFKGGHLQNASSSAVATITNPTIRTFTDTTAVAGKVYYYVVRPIDNLRLFPTYTPEIYSEVRVLASPTNYSFVHRWMVNQEICNGMKITTTGSIRPSHVDPTKNFRCDYQGPGESPTGYYDYGRDLLVDTSESGCPYAAAPKCSANGCVGIGAPTSTTGGVANNDLYYDRNSGSCYIYSGGWATVESSAAGMAAVTGILNTALNAPLVNVTQASAATICSARTAPTGTGATFGAPLLPSKKDFNAYASHPVDMPASDITIMEEGLSLNLNSRCNGSNASGLTVAYTDSAIPSTSFIYSLPGTQSSGIRSLYTGSVASGMSKGSESCVSRFGIQDLYGNVAEWTTDKMTCENQYVCAADPTASFYSYDFIPGGAVNSYGFDYKSGPYNDANGDGNADTTGVTKDTFLTSWTFSRGDFSNSKFSYPLGLPISGNITSAYSTSPSLDWMLEIGPSSGIVPDDLHEDGMIVNGANVYALTAGQRSGAFAVGGSYLSGQRSGRFTSELIPTPTIRPDVGFRCIIPIDSTSGYPSAVTSGHAYPY